MQIVFFDIDGTLIHSGGAGKTAFERTFQEEFGVQEFRGDVSFSGRSDRAIVEDLFRDNGVPHHDDSWQQFRRGYLDRLKDSMQTCNGRVLPGVVPLLEILTERSNVLLGLLTGNFKGGAALKLGHFELAHYFPFGGFGDQESERDGIARAAKRSAENYASENSLREPNREQAVMFEKSIVIGDTPSDVTCARAIDAVAVAVATGMFSREELVAVEPDLLLDDLSDPDPVLRLLSADG